jgi:hypothetical protein
MFLRKNIRLILFILWGLPLNFYRSRFRKIVYQTDKWTINIKPYFIKELKALFGNMYPDNRNYLKFRNFYRFYLIIYLLLFTSYLTFSQKNNMKEIKIGSSIPTFKLPGRVTFIADKKGKEIYIFISQTQAARHVHEALRILIFPLCRAGKYWLYLWNCFITANIDGIDKLI